MIVHPNRHKQISIACPYTTSPAQGYALLSHQHCLNIITPYAESVPDRLGIRETMLNPFAFQRSIEKLLGRWAEYQLLPLL